MSKKQQKKLNKIILTAGLGFGLFLFFLIQAPVKAAEGDKLPVINLNCFTKIECTSPPYLGTPSNNPVSECTSDTEGAAKENRLYYCYAPRAKFCQPGKQAEGCFMALEVSIGGQTITGLGEYIAAIYKFLVAISGILAGLMITYAGVKWMLASGNPEKINDAKHKVGDAIIGLILVVGSYVIMQTINPALVALQMPPVKIARQLGVMVDQECTMKGINQQDIRTYKDKLKCNQKDFDCSKLPAACGGTATGTCIGQYCDPNTQGGECSKLNLDLNSGLFPASEKYACIRESDCGEKCSDIDPQEISKSRYVMNSKVCVSSVCAKKFHHPCFIKKIIETSLVHSQCSDPQSDGAECSKDYECESGVCNQVTKKCSPKGGETQQKASCNRDAECHYPMICTTSKFPVTLGKGECWSYPGTIGAQCREEKDCISNICGSITDLGVKRCQ